MNTPQIKFYGRSYHTLFFPSFRSTPNMPQHCLRSRIQNVLHTCFVFMMESASGKRAALRLSCM